MVARPSRHALLALLGVALLASCGPNAVARTTPSGSASPTPSGNVSPAAAATPTDTPATAPPTRPPEATPLFYVQARDVAGFTVKASANVRPEALDAAAASFARLIRGDQAIVERMRAAKVEVAVIGQRELATDLPEYAGLRGRITADGRRYDAPEIRGLGGQPCAAGEENILRLAGDLFPGEDLLVHECAHAVYADGLDGREQALWNDIYHRAVAAGRWQGTYASQDVTEFFAELTQSYFGVNPPAQAGIHSDVNGAERLAAYEPDAARFLLRVFGPAP